MHRCLSCNQPCDTSSLFCNACRVSLLEKQGTNALLPKEHVPVPVSASPTMRMKKGHAESSSGIGNRIAPFYRSLAARRKGARRIRRALLLFCVVGIIAFLTDGTLLAIHLLRQHTPSQNQSGPLLQGTQIAGQMTPITFTQSKLPTGVFGLSPQLLVFLATQGKAAPTAQVIVLSVGGQLAFSWQIIGALPAWLHVSPRQGKVAPGMTASVAIAVQPTGLTPGWYTAHVLVRASDPKGKALAKSPQASTVTLGVHASSSASPPVPSSTLCTATVTPPSLAFQAVIHANPAPQTLRIAESDGCAFPVSWQATVDASWVTCSPMSGNNRSGRSVMVYVNPSGLLPGVYTAHITVQVRDVTGASVSVSPTSVSVKLTVVAG